MAIVNQPTPLSNELAWNGDKNPIPDTNDGSKGLFSVEYGFPYVTQQPLAQGGIPPQRNDFNGVLNLLSKFIRYFQNGGVFAYSENMDYSVGMLVRSGDRLYVCKAENGANTSAGVQNISNSNYWNEITLEDTLSDTLVNQFKTVLVTEGKTVVNTADWNTLIESRTYKITGATFAADKHQPVGAVGTGELVVLKNGDDTIAQVYYANSAAYDKAGAYHRMCINGTWTDWVYNITNKGGNITGDFTINGKLTVDSMDIKNNFTVAGGTPVTGDDLQKVQDQIIAPEQTFWIDCLNGSDETGNGKSKGTAVKTINKAFTLINPNVPTLTFMLVNADEEDRVYPVTCMDFYNYPRIKTINIRAELSNTTIKKPILNVLYSEDINSYTTPRTNWYGNILIVNASGKKVTIQGVEIQLDSYCPIEGKYKLFLIDAQNISFYLTNINISKELSLFLGNSIGELTLTTSTINNNMSGYLLAYHWDIARYTESPVENPEAENVSSVSSTPKIAYTSMINGTNIPSKITKYAPSIGLIYSNV